jgi:hypothetical protein
VTTQPYLEEVFDKGVVKPDEIVFTELMRGHLAADPPAWARVMGLLNRMPTYEVSATALTYNLLLAGWVVASFPGVTR